MPSTRLTEPASTRATLELEQFLPYRLSVLSNLVSQAIAGRYARAYDLTVTEWRVLAVLGRYQGLSAIEVGERIAMDKVAVSRAVARLLENGRITRALDAYDRRRSVLGLSDAGRAIYNEVAPMALEQERRLLSVLTADERAALDAILGKLVGAGVAALKQ
jgi:DNA-binding MarR family transcriptional regulator